MPNIKSAKKRVKVIKVKTAINKTAKSNLRTILKKAETSLQANAANASADVALAIKTIDKAVAKGILHKNNAARKKSQLTLKLNAAKA
ncbi:MAG: 30S ribosomal protein S20 [Oscillospiraceae bacterium]|nr:30S ribosomal protein S20 [Oscillospiraceae bacterium]